MKKTTKAFLVLIAASTLHLEAALPPFYESLREYKALLESPELEKQLGSGQMITDIKRDDNGFIVKSPRQTFHVDVVYDSISKPGPLKFHLVFHPSETNDQ